MDNIFLHYFKGYGINTDNESPFFLISYYESSGKWYDSTARLISQEELNLINQNKSFVIRDNLAQEFTLKGLICFVETVGTEGFCKYMFR